MRGEAFLLSAIYGLVEFKYLDPIIILSPCPHPIPAASISMSIPVLLATHRQLMLPSFDRVYRGR